MGFLLILTAGPARGPHNRAISSMVEGNRGVQRFPRVKWRLALECKGRRELDYIGMKAYAQSGHYHTIVEVRDSEQRSWDPRRCS